MFTMTPSMDNPVVQEFSLSAGDTLEIDFSFGYGFLIISQPNSCSISFGQGCSSSDLSSCTWYQTSRSDGVLIFGISRGFAEVYARLPGTFIMTAGYIDDSCCPKVWAYSGAYSSYWTNEAYEKDCIVQTRTLGTWNLSGEVINTSNVTVTGLKPGFNQTWTSSTDHPSGNGLTTLIMDNPTSGPVRFDPYVPGGRFFTSVGGSTTSNYGYFWNYHHRALPAIYVGQSTYTRVDFTAGRYVPPSRSRSRSPSRSRSQSPAATKNISALIQTVVSVVIATVVAVIAIIVVVVICRRKLKRPNQSAASDLGEGVDQNQVKETTRPPPGQVPYQGPVSLAPPAPPPFLPDSVTQGNQPAYEHPSIPPYPYGYQLPTALGSMPPYELSVGQNPIPGAPPPYLPSMD